MYIEIYIVLYRYVHIYIHTYSDNDIYTHRHIWIDIYIYVYIYFVVGAIDLRKDRQTKQKVTESKSENGRIGDSQRKRMG